jgi:NAD(P)-dependent dehydrogenase (short-subunit alcohol dehydrogenase family)
MDGKTCLVTGATSGIGKETAIGLARLGATVLLVGRDRARGDDALTEVRRVSPTQAGELFLCDLSSLAQVRRLADEVLARRGRLDVLVNNAGASYGTRRVTEDGLEATFATNHLGPFLLTHLLLGRLVESGPARIVNVASDTHRWVKRVPWDDLQAERRYRAMAAYNLSKLFVVLSTFDLDRRLAGTAVTANSLHPGWPLKTALDRDARGPFALFARASKRFGAPAADGARTPISLASAPEAAAVGGRYFAAGKPATPSALARDESVAARLREVSERLAGLPSTATG